MYHFRAQGVQFIAALRLLLSFVSVTPVVMDAPASLHNRSVFDSTAETIWRDIPVEIKCWLASKGCHTVARLGSLPLYNDTGWGKVYAPWIKWAACVNPPTRNLDLHYKGLISEAVAKAVFQCRVARDDAVAVLYNPCVPPVYFGSDHPDYHASQKQKMEFNSLYAEYKTTPACVVFSKLLSIRDRDELIVESAKLAQSLGKAPVGDSIGQKLIGIFADHERHRQ